MTVHSICNEYGLAFTKFTDFPAPFIMHYLLINLPIENRRIHKVSNFQTRSTIALQIAHE